MLDEQLIQPPLSSLNHPKLAKSNTVNQYSQTYDQLAKYVKSLRNQKSQITQQAKENLKKIITLIVDFISIKNNCENSLFLQALITLDNTLNVYGQILKEISFSKIFFINVNHFFLKICGNYDDQDSEIEQQNRIITSFQKIIQRQKLNQNQIRSKKQSKQSQKNFELYSVFYLVVMIIYQTNRRQDHSLFLKYLLNTKFLSQFFSLQLAKTNKMAKLIGIIITYLVKTINLTSEGKNLKRFILNNIHLASQDQRIQFYFFYSIRAVKQHIMLSQVKKYKILDFLVQCLSIHRTNQQTFYIYDTIQFLLKKYSILGLQLVNNSFFAQLQKDILRHQNQVLKIFQMIAPCIPQTSRQQCLKMHLRKLQDPNENKYLSFRMISILFNDSISQNLFIDILKSKIYQKMTQKLKDFPTSSEQISIYKFMNILMIKSKKINQSIHINLFYKLQKQKSRIPENARSKQFFKLIQNLYSPLSEGNKFISSQIQCFSIV